jgi:hypothetical protein
MALGISGIMANVFSWHVKANDAHQGVQIDLLIDRSDNVINVCEMKYAPHGFSLTSATLNSINVKMEVLRQYVSPRKFVSAVLITSNGVIRNKYSDEIRQIISAEQLFAL